MPIFSLVASIISQVISIGEKYIESQDKKREFEAEIRKAMQENLKTLIEAVVKEQELKAKVIIAEAASDSWLTRSWRPIVILVFTALIVLYWFGIVPPHLDRDTLHDILLIVQGAIWGYIGSRGIEKAAGKIVQAMLTRK